MLSACAGTAGSSRDDASAKQLDGLSSEQIVAAGDRAARQREFERALTFYYQAAELEGSPDTWFRIGKMQSHLGSERLAWQAYNQVLQLDSDYAGAHEEVGLILFANKKRESARSHLKQAVRADRSRWRSHNALGVLSDLDRQYGEAVRHYRAALTIKPNSAMLLNNLGYSYYLAGDYENAERNYHDAMRNSPEYQPAVKNIGLLQAKRGEYARATATLMRFGTPAQAHNDVGYVAAGNGDLDDAEALLTEAIRLSPQYYEVATQNLERLQRMKTQPPPTEKIKPRIERRAKADREYRPVFRVVTANQLNVRRLWRPDATVIGQLSKGETVELLYREGDWYWIAYSDASSEGIVTKKGWVKGEYLSRVTP